MTWKTAEIMTRLKQYTIWRDPEDHLLRIHKNAEENHLHWTISPRQSAGLSWWRFLQEVLSSDWANVLPVQPWALHPNKQLPLRTGNNYIGQPSTKSRFPSERAVNCRDIHSIHEQSLQEQSKWGQISTVAVLFIFSLISLHACFMFWMAKSKIF